MLVYVCIHNSTAVYKEAFAKLFKKQKLKVLSLFESSKKADLTTQQNVTVEN